MGNFVSKQGYTPKLGKNKTELPYSGHMEEKTTKTAQEQWRNEYIETIGRNVREYRDRLGFSAQQLSDRTEKAGFKIPRSSIANIETAVKKSYPIHEMVTLASALGLPLANLLANPYRALELVRPLGNAEPTPAYLCGGSTFDIRVILAGGSETELTYAADLVARLSDLYTARAYSEERADNYARQVNDGPLFPEFAISTEEAERLAEGYRHSASNFERVANQITELMGQKGVGWWTFEEHQLPKDMSRTAFWRSAVQNALMREQV